MLLLLLALLGCAAQFALVLGALRGARRLTFLRDVPPVADFRGARVSIVVAARNEERKVADALRSLLAQRYEPLEIVFVDDRSTDRTAELVRSLAGTDPRLQLLSVRELPPGWLGKNHALNTGAAHARGELLLFMDADVELAPDALARAVRYVDEQRIDHLALGPELRLGQAAGRPLMSCFFYFFLRAVRPWKARDPASSASIGVGAFNLVRAAAYRAVSGHARIALRPDDDLMLARLLKQSGFRADYVHGTGLARVEWYASVAEMIHGLSKNTFAVVGYSVLAACGLTLAVAVVDALPFLLLLGASGVAWWFALAAVLLNTAGCARFSHIVGGRALDAFALFPATLLGVFIFWNAVLRTLWTGGIDWRGTRYALAELRSNRL